MTKEMRDLLNFVNITGGNPDSDINTRKELTTWVKEKRPHWLPSLRLAWKRRYIRIGNLWGLVLTHKGLIEYFRTQGELK